MKSIRLFTPDTCHKKHLATVLYSLVALFACVFFGKLCAYFFPLLPSSLYGLVSFALALHFTLIDAKKVQSTVVWCIKNMGVCFVPAGVGIINHKELILAHGIAIFVITVLTTFVLISVVGLLYQHFENKKQNSINKP